VPSLDPTSAAGLTRVPSPEATARRPVPPQNSGNTALAIDAAAATEDIDAAATQPVSGAPFEIAVLLTSAGAPYVGFQIDLGWDSAAIIAFDAFTNAAAESFSACGPTRALADSVAVACLRPDVTEVNYTGTLGRFALRCIAAGTVTLRLREPGEGLIGTRIESKPTSSFGHILGLTNATITCG
jgi:hypothetical protein